MPNTVKLSAGSVPAGPQPIELQAGALRLGLRPDLGACITGLWHSATPILRSTEPAALSRSRAGAAYPLVPYSNRLADAKFNWQGRNYTTQPNFDNSPHSVHGLGWQRPWQLTSRSASEATVKLQHQGDADWPFAFDATQRFSLTPQALNVQMTFINTADVTQPVGLGWHPYFVKRERSHLKVDLTSRWDSDATELPVKQVALAGIDSDVTQLNFDNCFEGWTGIAHICDEKFSLQLRSSMDHLVIYTPQTKTYFCVEPVSHLTNAIHMSDPAVHGLRSVAPGASVEVSMTLDVELR